jgi:hypothetical protein
VSTDSTLFEHPRDGRDPLLDQPEARRSRPRMPRSRVEFVRVPRVWVTDPRLFGPRERLLLLLLFRSLWGQRPVELTTAVTSEIGLSRSAKHRYVRQLEKTGRIRVERHGQAAVTVTVITPDVAIP